MRTIGFAVDRFRKTNAGKPAVALTVAKLLADGHLKKKKSCPLDAQQDYVFVDLNGAPAVKCPCHGKTLGELETAWEKMKADPAIRATREECQKNLDTMKTAVEKSLDKVLALEERTFETLVSKRIFAVAPKCPLVPEVPYQVHTSKTRTKSTNWTLPQGDPSRDRITEGISIELECPNHIQSVYVNR